VHEFRKVEETVTKIVDRAGIKGLSPYIKSAVIGMGIFLFFRSLG